MIDFDLFREGEALDLLAEKMGISLGEQRSGLLRYAELVSQWGQRTDLVSAKTSQELMQILFLDSFILSSLLAKSRMIDIGAGAGAPTLPLLLLQEESHALLVEPRRRRVAFLRTAIGSLDLHARASVWEGRLEQEPHDKLFGYDIALSRATFSPSEWLSRGSNLAPRVVVLLGNHGSSCA